MTFSVLTTTYNRAEILFRAFESLKRQQFRNFEWVVIDDGSVDDTETVVESWMRAAPFKIRYFREPHRGKTAAFLAGVDRAAGEFVVSLDSDDQLKADALERFVAHWIAIPVAQQHRLIGITGLMCDQSGRVVGSRFPSDAMDSNPLEMRYAWRVSGDKIGFQRTAYLRELDAEPLAAMGFVPEGVIWSVLARRYATRYVNEIFAVSFQGHDQLTSHPAAEHAASLAYWHRWILTEENDWFNSRPIEFMRSAALFARFSLHAGTRPARQWESLNNGLPRALWLACFPVGLASYLIDRIHTKVRRADQTIS